MKNAQEISPYGLPAPCALMADMVEADLSNVKDAGAASEGLREYFAKEVPAMYSTGLGGGNAMRSSFRWDNAVFLLALVFGLGSLSAAWGISTETVVPLTEEDGVVENLSAGFWALGMGCSLVAIARRRHTRFAWLWVIICLFSLGEETSWFQRWIGYSVPSVEQLNAQSEFNIHNLRVLHGGEVLDHEGRVQFTWRTLLNAQALFTLGLGFYFLVLPVGCINRRIRHLLERIGYPRPAALFVLSMWAVLILSFVMAFFADQLKKDAVAETREMLYAFFVFLYLLTWHFNWQDRLCFSSTAGRDNPAVGRAGPAAPPRR